MAEEINARPFPVLMHYDELKRNPDCPRSVPWSRLVPFEGWAKRNHDQSLETLARRGGLDPSEIRCIVEQRGLRELLTFSQVTTQQRYEMQTRDVKWLIEWLAQGEK